ncbi:tyrosine-type recombinase/integrase [Halorubrum trueperi]|uniref:Tyrosine-type recombinase/integrase n=1 Tax=Halorubrum trueperi TaxID=2004704 RepID=A0ABD5UEI0_9EURY
MSEAAWSDEELLGMDTSTSADELEIKRDPIGTYIDRLERYGREARYVANMEAILVEFQAVLRDEHGEHLCNIDDSHVIAFNRHLKRAEYYRTRTRANSDEPAPIDISDQTRHEQIRRLSTFYAWLADDVGVVSSNPAKQALNNLSESEFRASPPDRPRIEFEEMADFVAWIDDPLPRTLVLFLLKSGARMGEALNVDLCCLNLDHPVYHAIAEREDVELLPEVSGRPDTVFLDPGFQAGTEIRGEVRESGSKRQRAGGTIVPLDAELKMALVEYLLTRRPTIDETVSPLFAMPSLRGHHRLTSASTSAMLTASGSSPGILQDYGWWEPGASTAEKVTAHYFRHYFTHNHRHNQGVHDGSMPETVIAYIRGDAPDRSTARGDNYRHLSWNDWESQVKEPYLEGIYQFGVYGDRQ